MTRSALQPTPKLPTLNSLQIFVSVIASIWVAQLTNSVFQVSVVAQPSILPEASAEVIKALHLVYDAIFITVLWNTFGTIPYRINVVTQAVHTVRARGINGPVEIVAKEAENKPLYAFYSWCVTAAVMSVLYSVVASQYTNIVTVYHGLLVAVLVALAAAALLREGFRT